MTIPTQILTETLFEQSDDFADSISKNNAVWRRLEEKKAIKKIRGGYEYREPVIFEQTGNGGWFSDLDPLDTTVSDDLTYSVYDVKQMAEVVGISGRELRANSGDKHKLIDVMEMKITAAKARMRNRVVASVYSDGTASSGKELDGLQKGISVTPASGSYGGIDPATYTWWQNVAKSLGGASSASTIQGFITDTVVQVVRGGDRPDLAVCDNTFWANLHDSLTSIQRIVDDSKSGMAGFQNIRYMNIDFVLDGGYGDQAPEDYCFILNTDYLKVKCESESYFKPLGNRYPIDQDGMFEIVLFEGNIVCSNRALQAVIYKP